MTSRDRSSEGRRGVTVLEPGFPPIDPACASVVAALEEDPFYRSICSGYSSDPDRYRAALTLYFAYSIHEGSLVGRCVHLADPGRGVAVWLLPQAADVRSRMANQKRDFLQATLDPQGFANYYRIIAFMSAKAADVVPPNAWYLSIVAVDPAAQGQGLGRRLLQPTLTEADSAGATCYLETFGPDSEPFYERLGFSVQARFSEPTAGAAYAVMARMPHST